jgi:hypothetical protein
MSAKWTLLSVSAPWHFDAAPKRPLVGTVHRLSQRRPFAVCRHREVCNEEPEWTSSGEVHES